MLLIFCMIFFANPVWAISIDNVVLKGNTKTRKSAVLRQAGIKMGKELTNEQLDIIIEKIKRMYQFNIVEITFQDNTLFVDIEDKWTFFPVPLISRSDNYNSAGIVLYDNNFLGRLATLAVGVSRANSRWNGILYWQEDGIIAKDLGMKVLMLLRLDLIEFTRGGKVISSLENKFNMLLLTPNYRHGKHNHAFGPIYINKKIPLPNSEFFEAERLGLSYRHRYNNYKKLPLLFDGYQTVYNISFIPKGDDYDHMQFGLARLVKPWKKHFFISRIHFSYTNNTGYLAPKMLGGDEGYSGYEKKSLYAQRNLGFAILPQIYVWKRWFVTPFYEFNHTKLIKPILNGAELNESAVGAKISYYFKKISIPAVSLGYTRNIDDKSNHFQFNVGLKL